MITPEDAANKAADMTSKEAAAYYANLYGEAYRHIKGTTIVPTPEPAVKPPVQHGFVTNVKASGK